MSTPSWRNGASHRFSSRNDAVSIRRRKGRLTNYLGHMSPRRATANSLRRERMLASPRFNGRVFQNTYPVSSGLKPGVARPTMRDFLCPDEDRIPSSPLPLVNPLPFWGTRPLSGLRVTWLGHSALLIEIDGVRILTDPVWSNRASPLPFAGPKRFHPPPAPLDAIPPLDGVILSHDHYDHLDRSTILSLAKLQTKTRIITSLGVGERLERWGIPPKRITELDWWDETDLKGVAVTAAPAQHFSGRGIKDRNATLWSSFHLRGPRHSFFFGADTGLTPEYEDIAQRLGPFDMVALEIGAYHPSWGDIHLGPVNALSAYQRLGQRRVSAHSLGDVQPGNTSLERTGGNALSTWHGGRRSPDHAEARRAR